MSAPVTEAHIARARASGFSTDKGLQMAAQFIANNEAAKAERDQLRAERDSIKQEIEMVEHRAYRAEAKIDNQAERIRYLEGATNHATGTPLSQAIARAERAEAELAEQKYIKRSAVKRANELTEELATERARLDWLEDNAGDIQRYNSSRYIWSANQNLRAAIDAAMKEGAK